jgi:hypothetical protein
MAQFRRFNDINISNLLQTYSGITITKVKVKVKLSLCFNWALRHEGVLGEWRYNSTHSFTSVLDGGEWSASLPGRFTPREKSLVPIG